jgi:hypothetical protein
MVKKRRRKQWALVHRETAEDEDDWGKGAGTLYLNYSENRARYRVINKQRNCRILITG